MVWTTAILTLVQPRAQMHFSFLAVQLCRALVLPLGGKWDLCARLRATPLFLTPPFPTGSLALPPRRLFHLLALVLACAHVSHSMSSPLHKSVHHPWPLFGSLHLPSSFRGVPPHFVECLPISAMHSLVRRNHDDEGIPREFSYRRIL